MSDKQDADRPKLNLGKPPTPRLRAAANSGVWSWLAVLIALQAVVLVLLLLQWGRDGQTSVAPSGLNATELKLLAIELEDRSLDRPAAETWQRYLQTGEDTGDQAEILYRMGKLYLQADDYAHAAAALVHCEQVAAKDSDLHDKVGPLLVECLRRLGLHGEVGRELSRQVEAGGQETGRGKVLATLAGDPLTEADLDRMVERRIDQMLALQGGGANETVRQQLLRNFSSPEMRRQLFQELLQIQLFTRRARELDLDQQANFQTARRAMEDSLLASRFMASQLGALQPTDVEVQSYYQANDDSYRRPATLRVLAEELQPQDEAETLLAGIESAEKLKSWIRNRRSGEAPDSVELTPQTLVLQRPDPQLGDTDALFDLEAGAWTNQPHEHAGRRWVVLVEEKTPASIPPLEEIRSQVEMDLTARKREERTQRLVSDLMQRYDVKMNTLLSEQPPQESVSPPDPDEDTP